MIDHRPTFWPHSGLWTLPDGRQARSVRRLDTQLDHRRERIADWRPVGGAVLHLQTENLMSRTMDQTESAYYRARERKFHRVVLADPMSADEIARVPAEKPAIPHAVMMNSKAKPRRRAPPPVKRAPPAVPAPRRGWTDEEERRAVGLRRGGASYSQVARVMGRTSNSVIGRMHRLEHARVTSWSDATAAAAEATP